ncbi:MAG: D-alanyl-D-alanine carboxypeptidase [Algoriphagus sp.]|nr:D-alanyl-D-alanine carboxypeptidase [Algoriphagus sp.]
MKKIVLSLLISSCFAWLASAQISQDTLAQLDSAFGPQSFFEGHLSGFMLYDLESKQVIFEKNSHLYQIPASTAKLLTLYGALQVLQDSTQTLRYQSFGDTLKIWGLGDPSWKYKNFYQPDFQKIFANHSVVQFSDANLLSPALGYAWQWDDYYFDYAPERSSLPIYGNLVQLEKVGDSLKLFPNFFQANIQISSHNLKELERDFHKNTFYFNPSTFLGQEKYLPFLVEPELVTELASQATGKTWIYKSDSLPAVHQHWRGAPLSPLLKEMMLFSDNFIAEQVLLMISDKLFQALDSDRAIDYLLKTSLSDLPDRPKWVDGSGLSRHNLITPRSLVRVVEKLQELLPQEHFEEYLAIGGKSGTLKNTFQAAEPYIFAKTGSMTASYSLAGLVKSKSGKTYAFAFMNSNFPFSVAVVRKEVEKVMVQVRDRF